MAMLLCSAISSNAWSTSACAPACLCDGNVPSLPVPSPQGFVLYEVCNLTDIEDKHIDIKAAKEVAPNRFDMGTYSYRGMVTLSGTVTKADDGLGPVVHFRPEQAPDISPNKSCRVSNGLCCLNKSPCEMTRRLAQRSCI